MNGIVFQRGQRYNISLLDLAIFNDVGLPAKTSSVQGIIAFSQSQFSINENGVAVQPVTLTRTGGSSDAITVTVNLTNGTAKASSKRLYQ